MLNDPILLDTSVWVDYFRRRPSPHKDTVKTLIVTGQVATCGMVYLELMRGISAEEEQVSQMLSEFPRLPTDWSVYEMSGNLSRDLQRKGIQLSLPDALIAATAMAADTALYTLDGDFKKISGLKIHKP